MAKQMGVPIGRLCAAVNTNGEIEKSIYLLHLHVSKYRGSSKRHVKLILQIDITHRVIQRGEFHKRRIQKTLSDAINIEVVSTMLSDWLCFHGLWLTLIFSSI